MRLDFNVIWVDDQPRAVNAQIVPISNFMKDEGFEFKPIMCTSLDEVRAKIGQGVFSDEVDLILADWDLGAGTRGQQAIVEIRTVIPYKDVLFYSAQTSAADLRRLVFENDLEGIYCASRNDLVEEINAVFHSLVKKVLDLDHTRGIVMGATSDIDHMVHKCLDAAHGKLQDADQKVMVKHALDIIEARVNETRVKFEQLKTSAKLADLFGEPGIFNSNDRLRVLSRTLQTDNFKAHAGVRKSVTTYLTGVVPTRNKLGHQVLSPEGRPTGIALEGGNPVSLADMRELRKLILDLRGDFRALHDVLVGGA